MFRAALSRYARLAVLFVCAGTSQAASPDVLRLVPDDVGFCLVVRDVRGHVEALRGSAFARQFWSSALGSAIRDCPDARRLCRDAEHIEKELGISWPQMRDELLGGTLVCAYRPEQDQGLIVIESRDAALLRKFVERLNEVQRKSGEVQDIQSRRHRGSEYQCRRERGGRTQFYYLHGPVLAVTSQEEVIRQVLDLERRSADGPSFVARQLERLGGAKGLAALWLNPRAFDTALARKVAAGPGPEEAVLQAVRSYWKALDGIVLSATIEGSELAIRLAVGMKLDHLPAGGRRLAAVEPKLSELWRTFPSNALVATAGRLDAAAWADFLGEFLPPESRKEAVDAITHTANSVLSSEATKDVLPMLGPDWGFCVTAPAVSDRGWFPLCVYALRVHRDDRSPVTDKTLTDGLETCARLATLVYNNSHTDQLTLKTDSQGPVDVRYLDNDVALPPGLRPAFALKEGYLVLASSPEAIRRFQPAAAPGNLRSATDIPLLRLDLKEWSVFLKERQEPIARWLADKSHLAVHEVARRLTQVRSLVDLCDRLELNEQRSADQFAVILKLRTAQPLRK